jgi:Fe2+ or Zn2+ uptake regulation protein
MCEDCRRVFDVEDDLPDLPDHVTGLDQFTVTGYKLTFSGTCPDCLKK